MTNSLDPAALDQLFLSARTYNKFSVEPVSEDVLNRLYDLYKWGPTSLNCQPARIVFIRGAAAKERLKPALMPNNVEKTMAAPVTAIVAYDSAFYDQLPTQFPANPGAREMFAGNAHLAADTAFRNSSLQGAYLIFAARALGLATGPMSGFHAPALDQAFFPEGDWKANFLVNLGWPDPAGVRPRGPRLTREQSTRIL